MEQIAIITLIAGYLAMLAWALKEAYYESARCKHLLESNRELHMENKYYREKLDNYYNTK